MDIKEMMEKIVEKTKKNILKDNLYTQPCSQSIKTARINKLEEIKEKITSIGLEYQNFYMGNNFSESYLCYEYDETPDIYELCLIIGINDLDYVVFEFHEKPIYTDETPEYIFTNWKTGKSFSKNTFEDFKKEIEKNQDLYFSLEED